MLNIDKDQAMGMISSKSGQHITIFQEKANADKVQTGLITFEGPDKKNCQLEGNIFSMLRDQWGLTTSFLVGPENFQRLDVAISLTAKNSSFPRIVYNEIVNVFKAEESDGLLSVPCDMKVPKFSFKNNWGELALPTDVIIVEVNFTAITLKKNLVINYTIS